MARQILLTVRTDDGYVFSGASVVGDAQANVVLNIPDEALLCFTLEDAAGNAFALPNGGSEEYYLGIDSAYGVNADLIPVGTADFNTGDWADEDPTLGKISALVDPATAAMISDIGSEASKSYQAQLLFRTGAAAKWQTLARFPVTVKNRTADPV